MKRILLAFCLVGAIGSTGCRRSDIRTVEVHVEDMKVESDVRRIAEALMSTGLLKPGDVQIDLSGATVTVTYDSMKLAIKNIEHRIADAGYSAYTVRPDGSKRQGVPALKARAPALPAAPIPAGPVPPAKPPQTEAKP